MKLKFLSIILLFSIFASASLAQITDAEKRLKAPGPRTQFKEILGVGFSYKF